MNTNTEKPPAMSVAKEVKRPPKWFKAGSEITGMDLVTSVLEDDPYLVEKAIVSTHERWPREVLHWFALVTVCKRASSDPEVECNLKEIASSPPPTVEDLANIGLQIQERYGLPNCPQIADFVSETTFEMLHIDIPPELEVYTIDYTAQDVSELMCPREQNTTNNVHQLAKAS